jgi:hypothetical protein
VKAYRFGDDRKVSVLLGLTMRQAIPVASGFLWLTLCLQTSNPIAGVAGLCAAVACGFARWRAMPLTESFPLAVKGWVRQWSGHQVWVQHSLLGAGPGVDVDVPNSLAGLVLLEATFGDRPRSVGVVHDRQAQTLSVTVHVAGVGFSVADPDEQDRLVEGWGSVLSPFARERCPVSKVVWQEWSHPAGIAEHRQFLQASATTVPSDASRDYESLLVQQAPFTVAHEVLVTIVVELVRVRARRRVSRLNAAIDVLLDEVRLFETRAVSAGLSVVNVLSPAERSTAVRVRTDPRRSNVAQLATLNRSLVAATGRGAIEWGPMAIESSWSHARVDGSFHRSYRVAAWPMLPMAADWMGLLIGSADTATRTVTVVMEPVPIRKAASAANREMASLESDADEKVRRQFRVTAKDKRRMNDVETREKELAVGFHEFTFVGLVTVTASDVDDLDDACAQVEQSAAQALLDLRPVDARHVEGLVASLPLGRDIKQGRWT